MQMSDLFGLNGSFDNATLSGIASRAPFAPNTIGNLGLFEERGQSTVATHIEFLNGRLGLINPTIPAGPYQGRAEEKRELYSKLIPYFKVEDTVQYSDLLNYRELGSIDTVASVASYVDRRIATLARDHVVNYEYQYINALQGLVKDAAGNVTENWNTMFGLTQATQTIDWDDAATNVGDLLMQAQGKMEEKLGNAEYNDVLVVCGEEAFRKIRQHPTVKAAYDYRDVAGNFSREGSPFNSFRYNGAQFVRYPNRAVSGQTFMPTDEALMVPVGVPGMFYQAIAPAPWPPLTPNRINVQTHVAPDTSYATIYTISAVLAINTRPDACVNLHTSE